VKVLAALDFEDSSLEALRQADALARGVGGTLAACHVLPVAHDLSALLLERGLPPGERLAAEEGNARDAVRERARSKLGIELSEVFVERGTAYAEIVRRAEAWGADYIVVGSHGHSAFTTALIGSSAERVARHAHASVLVARPVTKGGVVIAATDLSELSMPAIEAAAAAAKLSGAQLIVVSALELPDPVSISAASLIGSAPAVPSAEALAEVRTVLRSTLEQTIERLGVSAEIRVLEGAAARSIVELADELGAELVVVGTHGRTGLLRFALGSVAERVIRNAKCSVLCVRAQAPA
jgi:nucleotide-binding universal stress UspA family protein